MRPLRKCTWKDIKPGEVFAFKGCWTIAYKIDEERAMVLDNNTLSCQDEIGKIGYYYFIDIFYLCKYRFVKNKKFTNNVFYPYLISENSLASLTSDKEDFYKLSKADQKKYMED